MNTVHAQSNGLALAATPVQRVQVASWTGGALSCQDVVASSEAVCVRNPAPNASQPFVPSHAVTVQVLSGR
jgi:hypothetical protein